MADKNLVEQYTEDIQLNTQELEKNTKAHNDNTVAQDKNAVATKKVAEKTKELDFQMEKVGSTANTALGVLSASLSKTNPLLSQSIQAVQRLIPNIVAIGTAAKQAGSLAKAAISSTGVGLLITTITTVVTLLGQLKDKAKEAAEANKNAAEESRKAWAKSAEEMNKSLKSETQLNDEKINGEISYWKTRKNYIGYDVRDRKKTQEQADKEIATIDAKIKELEKELSVNKTAEAQRQSAAEKRKKAAQDELNTLTAALKGSATYTNAILEDTVESYIKVLKKNLKAGKITQDEYNESVAYWSKQLVHAKLKVVELDDSVIKFEDDMDAFLETLNSEEDPELLKQLAAMDEEMKNLAVDAQKYLDIMKTFEGVQTTAENASQVLGSIGTAYQSLIEYQLKAGKITQEEYNRQFEQIKAFQYAQTAMNGVAGAIKIWTGEGTNAYKAAMSVSLAAETVAALATIKAANLDSASGTTVQGVSVSYASPTPTQTYVTNVDTGSIADAINGVQTVLVVDDLNKVQNRSKRVKTQSSF